MCLGLGQAHINIYRFYNGCDTVTNMPQIAPTAPLILIHVNQAQAVCGLILILMVKIMPAHLTHGL